MDERRFKPYRTSVWAHGTDCMSSVLMAMVHPDKMTISAAQLKKAKTQTGADDPCFGGTLHARMIDGEIWLVPCR